MPISSEITKALDSFSGLKVIHQSCDPVNDVINRHHFTNGIPGKNLNFIPCLKLEILGRVYVPPPRGTLSIAE